MRDDETCDERCFSLDKNDAKRTWKGVKLVGPVAMLIDEYSLQQEEVFDYESR